MNNTFTEKKKLDAYLARQSHIQRGYNDAKQNDPLHIKACILYWAEGSKKPHTFEFTNCELETHKLMLNFLNEYFPNMKTKLRGCINFYPSKTNPYEKVLNYWVEQTGIPAEQFTKPTDRSRYYKIPKNNKYPNGILRISLQSVELIYYIYGAINCYIGSDIFSANTGR